MYIRYQTTINICDKPILLQSLDRATLANIITAAQQAGMISSAPAIRAIRVSEIVDSADAAKKAVWLE